MSISSRIGCLSLWVGLLAGCGGSVSETPEDVVDLTEDTSSGVDTNTPEDTSLTKDSGLDTGSDVNKEDLLGPPEFSARSHDGTDRGQKDLIGHPTVMWFFPFAGTPG